MTDISVVVPTWRESELLVECLKALDRQTVRNRIQVVVSRDGGMQIPQEAADLADLVVNGPRRGPATARNRGWKASGGRYILFTDSDCTPEPEWAASMAAALEAGADAVKGIYSGGGTGIIQRLAQVEFEERYMLLSRSHAIDMIDTYSAGFRRSALEEAGGFDESFPVADHEDVDLSYRLAGMGKKLAFVPDAAVGHRHRPSWRGYFGLKFSRGKWRVRVLRRFPGKALSDSYTPRCLKLQTLLAVLLLPVILVLPLSVIPAAAWVALFCLSCLPLLLVSLKHDAPLAPLIPVFALWRGLALGAGSVRGFFPDRDRAEGHERSSG